MMNRRAFLQTLGIGGVATAAAVREFPFRVFSFPERIVIPDKLRAFRFVRVFDPIQAKMISRWDVFNGEMARRENWDKLMPRSPYQAVIVTDVRAFPSFAQPPQGLKELLLDIDYEKDRIYSYAG